MSLQKVADAADLSKAHVWDIETGRHTNPSVNALVGLGSALGVSAVELFRAALR
jgi:transcriptional regulator with XRE-family HTH domain